MSAYSAVWTPRGAPRGSPGGVSIQMGVGRPSILSPFDKLIPMAPRAADGGKGKKITMFTSSTADEGRSSDFKGREGSLVELRSDGESLGEEDETIVGPESFRVLTLIGKGSFGHVYLV